jgi:hypothetical protein
MERSELINKVKTRIDEVSMSGDVIVEVGVENSKPYDSIISELLDESALEVLLKAPFYRLNVTNGATSVNASNGRLTAPADFLRLVSLKMSDWQQPVTELAIAGDEVAKRQANRFLRGGKAKPVGVLSKTNAGYQINYYSSSTHDVEEFLYIKRDTAENIADSQLVDAMVWVCAGKTLGVLGEANLANLCYENAKGLMV